MFATSADAFLRVCSALEFGKVRVWVDSSEEDGLVLVHASVGEEKGRVRKWHNTAAGHESVPILLEVAE